MDVYDYKLDTSELPSIILLVCFNDNIKMVILKHFLTFYSITFKNPIKRNADLKEYFDVLIYLAVLTLNSCRCIVEYEWFLY